MASELIRCLNSLPDEVIERIGSFYQCRARHELCRALLQPSQFKQSWNQLSSLERQVFLSFLFSSRAGVIKEREGEVWAHERRLSRLEWLRAMIVLRQRGWIYAFRNARHERVYFCPLEIRQLFSRFLFANESISWRDEREVLPKSEPGYGLGQALFHFLARLEHEPWHLTKTGDIHKKDAQKWDVELGLESAALRHSPWSDQELPPWVAFLLELSRWYGLIEENGHSLTVHAHRWHTWLEQDWEEMMTDLYWAVRGLVAQRMRGVEGDFLLLEEVEPRQWMPLSQWKAMKRCWYKEKGKDARAGEERLDAFIAMMVGAGWLEEGITKSGERCVRLTELPPWQSEAAADMPVYIQPDMELIVPSHFPLAQRKILAQMADFMGGEQMLFYLITDESLRRAWRVGMTAEEMIRHLASWSGQPVPEVVARKIRAEEKRSPTVYCDRVLQYVLPHPSVREQIRPYLSKWQATLLDDGRLLVPQAMEHAVTDWLCEAGLEVTERKQTAIVPTKSTDAQSFKRDSPLDWRIEDDVPELEAGMSGMERLPRLWWSGLHPYRLPMKRELIQQGICHGLRLKVERNGEQQIIFPLEIQERTGGWWLKAECHGHQIQLSLEQIDKVQIIAE
ncbi:helicase-associated domain-containing protein [Laceyella putida]|uniref:Helicase-associated domain-containing protein n=1 Tax=Laceyella putida TaxID=110101 RepID=A0ABW2RJZ2_9BACL